MMAKVPKTDEEDPVHRQDKNIRHPILESKYPTRRKRANLYFVH